MSDLDSELSSATRAFRPDPRGGWVAVAANAALAAVLLGIPYVRGQVRAGEAVENFAVVAACLHGGTPAPEPGLAMPPGDREHFAELVARAPSSWPGSCVESLHAMRPEPALFLFPSPKQAEEDLRRSLEMVEAEIEGLSRARARGAVGAVPERIMGRIAQLRRALVTGIEASGASAELGRPAIELAESDAVAPSRVPLRIAATGITRIRPEPGGLRVIASDQRGVTEVVVREGNLDVVDVRKPPSLRSIVLGPDGGFLLWMTSESTCAEDAQRCANRSLGLGRPNREHREPHPDLWLAAHPAGRVDRSVRVDQGFASVVARAPEGAVELRRFALASEEAAEREGDPAPADADAQAPPRAPASRFRIDAPIDFALFPRGLAWVTAGETLALHEVAIEADAIGREAAAIDTGLPRSRAGRVAVLACQGWRGVATHDAIALVSPTNVVVGPLQRPLREPLLGEDPGDDPVRLACHDAGVDVVAIDRERRLVRWACTEQGCSAEPAVIATDAARLDATHAAGTTLVAWRGGEDAPQIRVARVRGAIVGAPEVPAPCWDSGEGLCGTPILVGEGERAILCARERGDVLALEVTADGFARLPGL